MRVSGPDSRRPRDRPTRRSSRCRTLRGRRELEPGPRRPNSVGPELPGRRPREVGAPPSEGPPRLERGRILGASVSSGVNPLVKPAPGPPSLGLRRGGPPSRRAAAGSQEGRFRENPVRPLRGGGGRGTAVPQGRSGAGPDRGRTRPPCAAIRPLAPVPPRPAGATGASRDLCGVARRRRRSPGMRFPRKGPRPRPDTHAGPRLSYRRLPCADARAPLPNRPRRRTLGSRDTEYGTRTRNAGRADGPEAGNGRSETNLGPARGGPGGREQRGVLPETEGVRPEGSAFTQEPTTKTSQRKRRGGPVRGPIPELVT